MKQHMYKIAGIGAICLAFGLRGISQDAKPDPPPPPPVVTSPDSDNQQTEIIIRQKGDKDSKVTIETRNGDFYVNGKPLGKFEDENLEIEKRDVNPDDMAFRIYSSPFRGNSWDQQRFNQDLQNKLRGMQWKMQDGQFNSNAAFLGVASRKTETGGATILEVTKSSPAEKAGLKKGDIITKVNEDKIESPEDLSKTIHQYKPGDRVKITFKRDGKEQTVSAELDKSKNGPFVYNYKYEYRMPDMPDMPGLESPLWGPMPPKIGIKAQDSEAGKGVNILEVTGGSPAEKAGLKKGDLITRYDGNEVNSANDLVQQVREAREKSTVKVTILRDGKSQELNVKIPRKLRTAEL
jgi:serine protease Do